MGNKHSSRKANQKINGSTSTPEADCSATSAPDDVIKNNVLLLGTGDCGKSTLWKQIVFLCRPDVDVHYANGKAIQNQVIVDMRTLIELSDLKPDHEAKAQFMAASSCLEKEEEKWKRAKEKYDDIQQSKISDYLHEHPYEQSQLEKPFQHNVLPADLTQSFPDPDPRPKIVSAMVESFKALWADSDVQQARVQRGQEPYESHYFFDRIEEIFKPEYLPCKQDELRYRVRTCGILDTTISFNNCEFKLWDTGGQRCQRRKWIHASENVKALVFIGALTHFDKNMFEDESANCLVDSLACFDEVLGGPYKHFFEKSSVFLLLNKRDKFKRQIQNKKLSQSPVFKDKPVDYFEAFEGGTIDNYENGIKAIQAEFQTRFTTHMSEKELHVIICDAFNTDDIRVVMEGIHSVLANTEDGNGGGLI